MGKSRAGPASPSAAVPRRKPRAPPRLRRRREQRPGLEGWGSALTPQLSDATPRCPRGRGPVRLPPTLAPAFLGQQVVVAARALGSPEQRSCDSAGALGAEHSTRPRTRTLPPQQARHSLPRSENWAHTQQTKIPTVCSWGPACFPQAVLRVQGVSELEEA